MKRSIIFLYSVVALSLLISGCESQGTSQSTSSSNQSAQTQGVKCSNCGTVGQKRYSCLKCGKEFCQNCEKKGIMVENSSDEAHGICPNWKFPHDGHDHTSTIN